MEKRAFLTASFQFLAKSLALSRLLAVKKKIVRTMYNHNNRYKGFHNGIIPYLLSVASGWRNIYA